MDNNIVQIIVAILVGLGISIPVVYSLIKSVRQNVKEQRWDLLTKKAIDFMITAEENFRISSQKIKLLRCIILYRKRCVL